MTVLFFYGLFLYVLAFALPFINPAIVVPYDKVSALIWFFLAPAEMAIAFFLSPPRFRIRVWLGTAAAAIALTVALVPGLDSFWLILVVGAGSFLLTTLVFHVGTRARSIFVLEQFFLAVFYYRMLSFSQASQDIARATTGLTQLIMALTIVAFLIHGLVLYFTSQRASRDPEVGGMGLENEILAGNGKTAKPRRKGSKRSRREVIIYLAVGIPLLLALAFLIPPDFVKHTVVANLLNGQVHPKPIPLDQSGRGFPDNGSLRNNEFDPFGQNGRRFGRNPGSGMNGQQPGQNGQGGLQGIPADKWQDPSQGNGQGTGSGQGSSGQRAIMIVASKHSPVYAADAYFGGFDPVNGFVKSGSNPLNDLTHMRLIGTWKNQTPNNDQGRTPWTVNFFSTISDRVVPYLPDSIDPTVLKSKYYPFQYFYDAVSDVSTPDMQTWQSLGDLSADEKIALRSYLQVPLSQKDQKIFQSFLTGALNNAPSGDSYFGRIMAILKSFRTYQYQVGFTDDVTVAHLANFLTTTKDGDCTEFSNTAALLGRLAGIPSRVVTGWLASRNLQTPAHLRGLYVLQQSIPELQKYPLSQLMLVTTAHRHSWVQYYLPSYGWVDFESTAYAIPPPSQMNPNNQTVIIPLITPQKEQAPILQFPWLLVLQILALIAVAIVVMLYLYRYGREATLVLLARRGGPRGAWALYRVLLMRLAAAGYHLKPPSRTPVEYAVVHPEVREFAAAYTRLRYRSQASEEETAEMWSQLTADYATAIRDSRKRGIKERLRRIFSLRGLYY